jgi:alpha-L-fucosidase
MKRHLQITISCLAILASILGCRQQKTYQPTLKSVMSHSCPEWFKDAKFGMFIDWGIYSVPGWAPKREKGPMYPDWYLNSMYEKEQTIAYHKKTWGADFSRDDFIPMFTAAKYDPEKLIKLAYDCGVKYVIPFCKHHDGFCLWPSSYTKRDAMDMGPRRDLLQPLVNECKKYGLKFGAYFSVEEWEYPILSDNDELQLRLWRKPKSRLIPYDKNDMEGKITGKIPVRNYTNDYMVPQIKEFIDLYDPDILWLDGEWHTTIDELKTPEIVSYFYNQSEGRKQVAVNDRFGKGTRHKMGDFFASEYHSLKSEQAKITYKWEECRGISQSFGYNWQDSEENLISAEEFIHMFIEIVCVNGNLLLIVNLDGEGALPEIQEKRLKQIGEWLKINGEAIFQTKPWLLSSEGDYVRYTQSKDGKYLYAICLKWPGQQLILKSTFLTKDSKVTMLGIEDELQWKIDGDDLIIDIPTSIENNKPCLYAYVLKLETNWPR